VAPGVYERRFTSGIVVANVSGSSVTVNLGGTYKTVSGSSLGSVTLANGNGAVLVSGCPAAVENAQRVAWGRPGRAAPLAALRSGDRLS